MNISRRIVVLSIGLAAAAGLGFTAILERPSPPELSRPVELIQDDDGDVGRPAVVSPPAVPTDPVPVAPRAPRREDDARPAADEDDGGDDRPEPRGDDGNDDDGGGEDSDDNGGSGDD